MFFVCTNCYSIFFDLSLKSAVRDGNYLMVEFLIGMVSNIDLIAGDLLCLSAHYGNYRITELLIQKGCNVNKTDYDGKS